MTWTEERLISASTVPCHGGLIEKKTTTVQVSVQVTQSLAFGTKIYFQDTCWQKTERWAVCPCLHTSRSYKLSIWPRETQHQHGQDNFCMAWLACFTIHFSPELGEREKFTTRDKAFAYSLLRIWPWSFRPTSYCLHSTWKIIVGSSIYSCYVPYHTCDVSEAVLSPFVRRYTASLVRLPFPNCKLQLMRGFIFPSYDKIFFLFYFFYNYIVPLGFLPWETQVAFPGERKQGQSRATQS